MTHFDTQASSPSKENELNGGKRGRLSLKCIGRELEIERFKNCYQSEAHTSGHTLLVCGPKGVGKRHLLTEFKRQMNLEGVGIFEAICRKQTAVFAPFLSVLRQTSSYLNELAPDAMNGATGFEMSRLIASMGRMSYSTEEERDGHSGQSKIVEVVVKFLTEVSLIRPPVVIFHDLHRAAPSTLQTIEKILTTLAPSNAQTQEPSTDGSFRGLFVLSWRTNEHPVSMHNRPFWMGGISHEIMRIGGLPRTGVAAFLKNEAVVDRFTQLTGGNPRNLKSLLTWGSPDADEVVRSKLLSVSKDAQALSVCCALMDRPLGPALLKKLTRYSSQTIGKAIEELLGAELVVHSVVTGELQIKFASASDGDAVLEYTPLVELRNWRLRIAEQFLADGEKVAAAEQFLAAANGATLSFQSERLPSWDTLFDIVLEAGDSLEVIGDLDRAIDLYRDTLSILPQKNKSLAPKIKDLSNPIRFRLVKLMELNGQYSEALTFLGETDDDTENLEPLWLRGHIASLKGLFSKAEKTLLKGKRSAKEKKDFGAQAQFSAELCELSFKQGSHQKAEEHYQTTIELLSQVPDQENTQCSLSLTMGKMAMELGNTTEALDRFNDALERARVSSLTGQETRSLINLGIFYLKRGEHTRTKELYLEALEASKRGHDSRHQAFCLQNLAVLAHWRRDYSQALKRFHESVSVFQRLGNSNILAWLALDLGEVYLELGDSERAKVMAKLSTDILPNPNSVSVEIYRALLDGRLTHDEGHFLNAKRYFLKALQLSKKENRLEDTATAQLELVALEKDLGNLQTAKQILQEASEPTTIKSKAFMLRLNAAIDLETATGDPRTDLLEALQLYERLEDLDGQWKTEVLLFDLARSSQQRADAARWKRIAKKTEKTIRSSVPEDLLDKYLQATHRRYFLEKICSSDLDRFDKDQMATMPSKGSVATREERVSHSRVHEASTEKESKALRAMLGQDPRFIDFLKAIKKVAKIQSTVLLRGESGTGKELAARAIHALSLRADKPLIEVNCGALVETLLLSELFGHERGAFTGATRSKKGRFELAEGGTLFLDEIGDISPRTQVALLRVLQEKSFERVGGTESIQADVRIVCATNRNLESMVKEGTFREDLYYRLKTLELELPPLRERGNDVLLIADQILKNLAEQDSTIKKQLSADAQSLLLAHPWYGNVRELENVLRSCWIFNDGDDIQSSLLEQFIKNGHPITAPGLADITTESMAPTSVAKTDSVACRAHKATEIDMGPSTEGVPLEGQQERAFDHWYEHIQGEGISLKKMKKRLERECIRRALNQSEGNITQAAKLLGMKRPRLSQLVKEHGLNKR